MSDVRDEKVLLSVVIPLCCEASHLTARPGGRSGVQLIRCAKNVRPQIPFGPKRAQGTECPRRAQHRL
jgi:hypothetical protein